MKVKVYSNKGLSQGDLALPGSFSDEINMDLMAQAIHIYRSRMHPGTHMTKTRGKIALSTRKIYRQKGTGGARHGAKSAPIFVGGGKAHGPDGRKRILSLSSAMKKKALNTALSLKAKRNMVCAVSELSKFTKTKEAVALIQKLISDNGLKANSKFTFVIKNYDDGVRAFKNIKNVKYIRHTDLNVYDVFYGGMIVLEESLYKKEKAVKKTRKTK